MRDEWEYISLKPRQLADRSMRGVLGRNTRASISKHVEYPIANSVNNQVSHPVYFHLYESMVPTTKSVNRLYETTPRVVQDITRVLTD